MSRSVSPKRRKHSKLREKTVDRIPPCPVTRKYSYRSSKRAKTAMNYARSHGHVVTEVYKCRHCGEWHLTSAVQRG